MKQTTGYALARRIRRFIRGYEGNHDTEPDSDLVDRLWEIVFTLERGGSLEAKQSAADEWTAIRSTVRRRVGFVNYSIPRWLGNSPATLVHWLPLPKPRNRTYKIIEPEPRTAKDQSP